MNYSIVGVATSLRDSLCTIRMTTRFLICLLFTCVIMPTFAFTQTAGVPAADDHELYIAAIKFLHSLDVHTLQERNATERASLHEALCKELSINETDLLAIITDGERFDAVPIHTGMKGIKEREGQRELTILAMKQGLSTQGWNNFSAFVLGPFRQATIVISSSPSNSTVNEQTSRGNN